MNESNWKIDHRCPQCGAPVELDETDHLLSCSYCRTKLYLVTPDYFRYQIPAPGMPGREMLYLPYWRLKGTSYSVLASDISTRFIDASVLAANHPGLPPSLGLRPQAMKLKYVSPETPGRFLDAGMTPQAAMTAIEAGTIPEKAFLRELIGEMLSLVYSPAYEENGILHDALLKRPLSAWENDAAGPLTVTKPPNWQIRFIPTQCPHCGWDLEGEKDALVLLCRNCDSAWECPKTEFAAVPFTILTAAASEGVLYLPFWRMKPRAEGIAIGSYADLIRIANLPKTTTPAHEARPAYFWSPAFKVHSSLFLRWARQMTVFQPEGRTCDHFADASFYPVTLAGREAVESMKINLAGLAVEKRQLYPRLKDIRLDAEELMLVWQPFRIGPRELLHETMRLTIDRTALAYGAYL